MLLWLRLTPLGRRGDEGPPGGVDDAEETEFEAVDGVEVGVPGVFSTDGDVVEDTCVGERAEASADKVLASTEPKPPARSRRASNDCCRRRARRCIADIKISRLSRVVGRLPARVQRAEGKNSLPTIPAGSPSKVREL